MATALASTSLESFFQGCVRQSLDDLVLPVDEAASYLADLLTRYAVPPSRPGGLTEMLGDVHRAWQMEDPAFDPEHEVELRREIGDYTLFMTGFFWERVEAMSAQHHYARLGAAAYRFVAEHHRAAGRADAGVYFALANDFMRHAVVLMYVREIFD